MGGVKSKQETLWILLVCEMLVFGAGFVPSLASTRPRIDRLIVTHESPKEGQDPDLFDYFDPLLSPHQYPNGISPENKLVDLKEELDDVKSESDSDDSYQGEESVATKNPTNQNEDQDLFDYFDPLRSPHEYPNGITPNIAAIDESEESQGPRKVGVLLMDHGSKNEASNSRLKHLAELYQLSTDADKESIVVEYSHMEIASPSIPEGLEKLMNMGVDEIICHPYFLSPGRHVREDIPRIVNEAVSSLEIEIPVITTDPVGSNTQLMIGAIHSLVRENSDVLQNRNEKS